MLNAIKAFPIALLILAACSESNNADDPIIPADATVRQVATGFQFTEGPIWSDDGYLLFSDIPANTIYSFTPGEQAVVFRQPSGNSNGNMFDLEGRLISCEHGNRRVSRTEQDGTIITLANTFDNKSLNSPNDLTLRADGTIFFTDPPYGISSNDEELGFYGVYAISPNGELSLLTTDLVRPNGIALSPDASKLYVNDSQEKFMRVYDVNEDGSLSNGRQFADLTNLSGNGTTDGMKVDTLGNIFTTGPGGVVVYSPEGELIGTISVPEVTTNVAWGGEDYSTLYITANTSVYSIKLNTAGLRP